MEELKCHTVSDLSSKLTSDLQYPNWTCHCGLKIPGKTGEPMVLTGVPGLV